MEPVKPESEQKIRGNRIWGKREAGRLLLLRSRMVLGDQLVPQGSPSSPL